MVPARPVLIPCFRETDSRLQNEELGGTELMSGKAGFAEAMGGL
jgi:hypothetical protein